MAHEGWGETGCGGLSSCSLPRSPLAHARETVAVMDSRTQGSSLAICVAPGSRVTCRAPGRGDFSKQTPHALGHASRLSLAHPLCIIHWHGYSQRNAVPKAGLPALSPWYTAPASCLCRVVYTDASCQWHHINSLLCSKFLELVPFHG